jgi:heat shock protein HslJ
MRIVRGLAALTALTLLAACSSGGSGATTVDLTGSWTLLSGSTADGEIALVPDAPVTMDVSANTSVAGSSGCNRYTGQLTVDGPTVSFGPLASTRMACRDDVMAVEGAYLGALEGIDSATRDGESLVLTGGGAALTFGPTP